MTALRDWQTGEELLSAMAYFSNRGWTPATSSNFSFRSACHPGAFFVTKSGIDKGSASGVDFILVGEDGTILSEPRDAVPSAESALHRLIYRQTSAGAVVHLHSVYSVIVSMGVPKNASAVSFAGLEILKGLGHATHDVEEIVPIFANSQDMDRLAGQIEEYWHRRLPAAMRAFLICGHGVYCWGKDVAEARRVAEVLEYLFEWKVKGTAYDSLDHTR